MGLYLQCIGGSQGCDRVNVRNLKIKIFISMGFLYVDNVAKIAQTSYLTLTIFYERCVRFEGGGGAKERKSEGTKERRSEGAKE
jgi:hypothetical protein